MKLANDAWYETFEEGPYTTLLDGWATPADHETFQLYHQLEGEDIPKINQGV